MINIQITGTEGNVEDLWGDQLEPQEGCMRISYNNCDGLQIKDFMRTTAMQTNEIKKGQMLKSSIEISKLGRCAGLMRTWGANIVYLAETQSSCEISIVKNAVKREVKRLDQYGGFI